ncbi:hypothetical protein ACERIT_13025 [Halopenitus sp. H-Gu1]|uniref:hypothetical protein n=1 Tax=Halopenitus sp. H-Gu1 TaxID=3242697 RepID=UPI00359ED484
MPSERDSTHSCPRKVSLERSTVQRLWERRHPEEQTIEEIITRLLTECETRRPLDEFLEQYIQARGETNVLEITIETHDFRFGDLWIKSYASIEDELPEVVLDTDVVCIEGHPYELRFEELHATDIDLSHRKLYVSDRILGEDSLDLDAGIAAIQDHVRKLIEDESYISQVESRFETS